MTQSNTNVNWHSDKGVIYVGDGTGVLSELSVGTNDQVMTADSAQSSGVKWAAVAAGDSAWNYISTATASSSADISFTSNIDSTYGLYVFILTNVIPATDDVLFYWRSSTDGGATYDSGVADYKQDFTVESGAQGELNIFAGGLGSAAGESFSGYFYLYNPSNSVTLKYTSSYGSYIRANANSGVSNQYFYRDSTADIDAIKFFMASGNIESGTIRMYGISNS